MTSFFLFFFLSVFLSLATPLDRQLGVALLVCVAGSQVYPRHRFFVVVAARACLSGDAGMSRDGGTTERDGKAGLLTEEAGNAGRKKEYWVSGIQKW